jgi:hypothetical protein
VIALAVALGVAAAPEPTDLTTRVRDSAAAAQALLGPLDGRWTLSDLHGRDLFALEITDPAGGAGALEGAWSRSGETGSVALIDAIARRGDHLAIRFTGHGEVVRLRLRRGADGAWSGEANDNGRTLQVALRRTR